MTRPVRLGHEPPPSETPTNRVPFKDLIEGAKYKYLDKGQDVKRFWRNLIKEELTTNKYVCPDNTQNKGVRMSFRHRYQICCECCGFIDAASTKATVLERAQIILKQHESSCRVTVFDRLAHLRAVELWCAEEDGLHASAYRGC